MTNETGSVAQYLADTGAITDDTVVAVWPHPYGDQEVWDVADHDGVDTMYVANGTGPVPRVRRLHEEDETGKVTALDAVYEREVLSHDLPDMVAAGEIDPVDVEFARDPAMSVMYDPAHGDAVDAYHRERTPENRDRMHATFMDVLQRNADTSAALVGENGCAVYATNDFGLAARSPVIEEDVDGFDEKTAAYESVLVDTLQDRFDTVSIIENDGSQRPVLRGQRYITATNRAGSA